MKQAQFEILGLAVIVIIISIMIFFALSFSLQEQDDVTGQFLEEQFAQNLIDATLKTSLDGCRGTISDYLISQATQVPLRPIGNPSQQPACATSQGLEEIADAIETAISLYQNTEFYLEVRPETCDLFDDDCETLLERGQCDIQESVGRPGRQPLSLYPQTGTMEIILWVC